MPQNSKRRGLQHPLKNKGSRQPCSQHTYRHPNEPGPKGALVVDLESNSQAQVQFVECDVARWEVLAPDISACADLDDVVASMRVEYETATGQAAGRPVVARFLLAGATPAARDLVEKTEELNAAARVMIGNKGALDTIRLDGRIWVGSALNSKRYA